jgi:hypothetical protein
LIPEALLDALDKLFPDKCPDRIKDSDRDIWFKAGQRSVVTFLRDKQARQAEQRKKQQTNVHE